MRPLAPLLLLLTWVLLTAACVRPAEPPAVPESDAVSGCAVSDEEEPADDCGVDSPERHPPGGLPQLLTIPAPANPPPASPLRVETVAEGLSMPLGLVWTPDGRKLFFSEVKLGQIRLIVDGVLQPEPFVKLPIA